MITKTKLFQRLERKNNPELVDTLMACKKNEAWMKVGGVLSRSKNTMPVVNLDRINKECKEGDIVVVPGKVLSNGDIDKKIRIAALRFSESAREKLGRMKSEIVSILEEIKRNPKAQGIKVIQ